LQKRLLLRVKNLLIPMLLLTLLIVVISYLKPFLIIDETRYIGVAWEMFNSGNYLVPTLNGVPYDHKPPLLFWLINLDWHLFGLNTYTLRFIPLLFGIGIVFLNYKIYKLLWKDDKNGAKIVAWVTISMLLFSFYTTLFMFDIMLSFWVLLAMYGGLKIIKDGKLWSYFIFAFAIWFGILAKSPVILAHLLPLYLFANFWSAKEPGKSFYIGALVALLIGVALALTWMIPAAKMGGEAFARGIFWEQYAGRAVDAFAHKRPFWWYLPWVPLILFPWLLNSNFYIGLKEITKSRFKDEGVRFLFVWIVGTFIIFSLISGKQLHYIVPEFSAFALLITRAISLNKKSFYRARVYGALLIIVGIGLIVAPWFIKGYIRVFLDSKAFIVSGIVLGLYGVFLFIKKFKSKESFVKVVAISSILIIVSIHYIAHIYLHKQDLTKFSQAISKLEQKGIKVAHYGKYHNQYQYFGRLKKPLVILWSKKSIEMFIKNNPNGAIITYKKRDIKYNKDAVIATTKFRTQNALLVKAKMWKELNK